MIKYCKENKRILLFSFLSTIFIHLIKFVNYYPTWDSVYGINKGLKGMTKFGRWFSGILANLTSSPYDLQWIEGVASAVFISFSIVLFMQIFDIQNKKYQYICVISFVTFPCLTATFVYQLWSSAYMCALLFAVLAVYLCTHLHINRIASIALSIILFALSLGTYQIYYTFAFLTFLFYIFAKLLKGNRIKELKTSIINFSISFVSGAVIYWVINKVVLNITKIQLSDYQGISETHFPSIKDIISALNTSFKSFISFFRGDFSLLKKDYSILSFYSIINILIAILLVFCVIKFVLLNRKLCVSSKIIMMMIIVSIVPIGYAFNFISSGVEYHRLMEFGNYFVYFLLILFLQYCTISKKQIKQIILASLITISLYNFINTNIAYHQMSISYEKTYFQNIEIASKIDEASDEDVKTVAIIGWFKDSGYNIVSNPSITGATTSIFTWSQDHIIRFSNYYLGRSYIQCEQNKLNEIIDSNEFETMKDFPSKNSVKVINDVVVVKLSDPNDNL